MSKIRASGNKDTEVATVRIFKRSRITGWRRNSPLPGKPDFIFPRHKLAVFIDGCFWHFCPKHGRKPSSNTEYWDQKLERNRKRDRIVSQSLRRRGWRVLRLWEHDLRSTELVVKRVQSSLFAEQP